MSQKYLIFTLISLMSKYLFLSLFFRLDFFFSPFSSSPFLPLFRPPSWYLGEINFYVLLNFFTFSYAREGDVKNAIFSADVYLGSLHKGNSLTLLCRDAYKNLHGFYRHVGFASLQLYYPFHGCGSWYEFFLTLLVSVKYLDCVRKGETPRLCSYTEKKCLGKITKY